MVLALLSEGIERWKRRYAWRRSRQIWVVAKCVVCFSAKLKFIFFSSLKKQQSKKFIKYFETNFIARNAAKNYCFIKMAKSISFIFFIASTSSMSDPWRGKKNVERSYQWNFSIVFQHFPFFIFLYTFFAGIMLRSRLLIGPKIDASKTFWFIAHIKEERYKNTLLTTPKGDEREKEIFNGEHQCRMDIFS